MSIIDISAAIATVVGLRPGDLLNHEPVEHHTLVLDGWSDLVLVVGSLEQLDTVAHSVRREVTAIGAATSDAGNDGGTPPTTPGRTAAGDLPPTLDYIAVDPDGRIRLVSAILTTGGALPILQSAVDGNIEQIPTSTDLDCFANEEGMLLGLAFNPIGGLVHQHLTGTERPWELVGTLVFVGTNGTEVISLTTAQQHRIVEAWMAVHRDRYRG